VTAQITKLARDAEPAVRAATLSGLAGAPDGSIWAPLVVELANDMLRAFVTADRSRPRRWGRQMPYRLTHPQLLTWLGSAEELLTATGNAVDLCPVYGHGEQDLSA
jgi:hypothetical protein